MEYLLDIEDRPDLMIVQPCLRTKIMSLKTRRSTDYYYIRCTRKKAKKLLAKIKRLELRKRKER